MMFAQVLYVHWKAGRWVLIPVLLLAFGLPLLALRTVAQVAGSGADARAADWIVLLQGFSPVFPLVALLLGTAAALTAWSWDHRGDHIYALSLPLHRRDYALLKFAGGMVLVGVPVLAALAGVLMATFTTPLPAGLQAYPFAFTMRFLLAAVLAYALMFALAAGTKRTTTGVVIGIVAFLVFGTMGVDLLQTVLRQPEIWTPKDVLDAALNRWPGPFHVFGGNWLFVDV
jgi:ABC-type transport system involved in multi-copper enzyme maturation permease subunit